MSGKLTERMKPYVEQIIASANDGDENAKQVISLHRMHVACPSDPGAPALCEAAFDAWLAPRAALSKGGTDE